MEVERGSVPDLEASVDDGNGEAKDRAWLLELADEVERLMGLLKRQRTALARHDLPTLSRLLTEQEQVVGRLNRLADCPQGSQILARSSSVAPGNPAVAALYRRLLAGLVELAAVNRANQHFLICARQSIQGALYWHPGNGNHDRPTSYTRRGRIAV